MLNLFQATNVQEDQQIITLLKRLRKEKNKMTPKENKWTSFVNYHSSELAAAKRFLDTQLKVNT
jgi:hypothetical protein